VLPVTGDGRRRLRPGGGSGGVYLTRELPHRPKPAAV